METKEDLSGFYKRIGYASDEKIVQGKAHINVFERVACKGSVPYSRRDYYKVTLLLGNGVLEYSDKRIVINRPALMFSNPLIPYNWQPDEGKQEGWFCIFNEAFVRQRDELLSDLPMFQLGSEKVYFPDAASVEEISDIYRKMMAENRGNYAYKGDLLRNYLHLVIHYALKMQPNTEYEKPLNAASRITSLFLDLLERQFPVDSMENQLKLTSAADFAHQLSVHTNHLNRAVKEITGKTTTEHIAARVITEANELLIHSNWPVADIAYCLGFEYPAYFNNFFKKETGKTPKEVRKKLVAPIHSTINIP